MAAKKLSTENEVETSVEIDPRTGLTSAPPSEGVRVTSVLTMKRFATQEWILQNCVVRGKGSRSAVARIIGAAIGWETKITEFQGERLESIALSGTFEGTSYVTGEIIQATMVYLPMAYARQVAMAFSDETVKLVELDLDIGVEATGKSIPYEWTCTSFVSGTESNILTRLRNRRKPQLALENSQMKLIEG